MGPGCPAAVPVQLLLVQAAVTMRVHVLHEVPHLEAAYAADWVLLDPRGVVFHGDALHLPEMITGAGDFEGFFFAGEPSADGRVRMLPCDVEELVFPASLQLLAQARGSSLRRHYERAAEFVCQRMDTALGDIYGDDAAVEDMWANPPLGDHPPGNNIHEFALADCQHEIVLQYEVQ